MLCDLATTQRVNFNGFDHSMSRCIQAFLQNPTKRALNCSCKNFAYGGDSLNSINSSLISPYIRVYSVLPHTGSLQLQRSREPEHKRQFASYLKLLSQSFLRMSVIASRLLHSSIADDAIFQNLEDLAGDPTGAEVGVFCGN